RQLGVARGFGVGGLPAKAPFPESQQQLFRGPLVDPLCRGAGVELRIELAAGDELLTESPMLLGVEVLRPELSQDRHERPMRGNTGERVALEPLPRVEQPWRDPPRRRRGTARPQARPRPPRQIELV